MLCVVLDGLAEVPLRTMRVAEVRVRRALPRGLGFRVTGSQVNVSVCLRVWVCVKTLNP